MIRRRAKPKPHHGAVRVMKDGREICTASAGGEAEYARRRLEMRRRQGELCCLCGQWMAVEDTTFEHENGRGGGKHDDRIEIDGVRVNGASHLKCNSERGSKKTPFILE